jgi:hypothetical protein
MRLRRTASLVLALVLAAPPAWADRSRLAEDEDGVEAGDCEAEVAFERSRARGVDRQRETAVQLSCGIGWRSELTLTAARQRAGDERSRALALELKAPFVPRRAQALGWAVLAAAAAEQPAGRSWKRSEVAFGLEATIQPRPTWLGELQFGWARDLRERADRFIWTIGVEHTFWPAWELRAELEGTDREPAFVGAALRWAFVPERAQAKLAWARQLGSDRERKLGLALGIEF